MDITKNLPTKLKVEDPNGRLFTQEISYDWVPTCCPKCLTVGHKCQNMEGVAGRPVARPRKRRMEWKTRTDGGKVV